jgi:UDP-N-acetylmuramate dehydrogenase
VTRASLSELSDQLDGELRFDVPLAKFTTFRIGGPAAALVVPRSADDIIRVLRFAQESGTRWLALGLGSNVLISDRGFAGIVVRIGKGLDWVEEEAGGDPNSWSVGAGLPTPLLARRSAQAGLAGVHRLIGVPGTVGGGVFMNAGAHGQDFSQVVRRVEVVEGGGNPRMLDGSAVPWRYRSSGLDGNVVVGATLSLVPANRKDLEHEIRQHFRWRKAGTPFDEPCCGSVFRNPSTVPGKDGGGRSAGGSEPRSAGQLIDACGLKGFQIGGARVSPMHANYIVNVGEATAKDVLSVIDQVRERVLEAFGIELELEVKVIGES